MLIRQLRIYTLKLEILQDFLWIKNLTNNYSFKNK